MSGGLDIKIFIIDDENDAILVIEKILQHHSLAKIVGKETDSTNVINKIKDTQPDLILCDIAMPGLSGMELVKQLRSMHFYMDVVFLTAHKDYALDAYKYDVFDYMLKPVDPLEMYDMLDRWYQNNIAKSTFNPVESNPKHSSDPKNVHVKFNNMTGFVVIKPSEIIFMEANANYTFIHLTGQRVETITQNMGTVLSKLDSTFIFRLGRSHAVNTQFVTEVDRRRKICKAHHDGQDHELPISLQRIREIENLL